MMIKVQLLTLLLICCSFFAAAQEAVLSGRVTEAQTANPVVYATIVLKSQTGEDLVAGALSDEEGRFTLSGLVAGQYRLEVSFVGYAPKTVPILIGALNNIYNLGTIELESQAQNLDEVTVEAQRAIVAGELDRKTFAVSDNIAQSGGSVLDVMKGLPGVTVDQEGNVVLRGSDKVAVLIDGKQSSLTGFGNQKGLSSVPAANIERIEIINNPSAKYDAVGMAGIINIIYKKEKESGWNGDVGFMFGLAELTTRKTDLPTDLGRYNLNPKYIPSLNLNYRASQLTFFLQSEVLQQKALPNNEFTTRTYKDGRTTISQVPENRTQTQYIVKTGLDWLLNERNTLSFSTIIDYESHVDTAQIPYINLNTDERYRYWHWKEKEVTGFLNFRLNYEHQFKEVGHELQASAQYTRGWEDEEYLLNDSTEFRQATDRTHIIATEHTTAFTIDYTKPLFYGRLEAGTKLQLRKIPVTYEIGQGDQSIIYPGLGEYSDWGENIYAAYLNYIYECPAFDIEAGLRLEQTEVYYDIDPANIYYARNDAYDYFRLYPNIRLTFKLDAVNNISLFFNNRVDRPGEPNLRIFPKYDDPELLKVGNPYVRPQFTQTYEVAYKRIWNSGSAFLSVYYRNITDPFIRVYSIDESNSQYAIINKIYQNVGSGSNLGAELLISQKIKEYWNVSGSINWYQNKIDAYIGMLLFPYQRPFSIEATSDLTWDFKLNNQLILNKNTQIQLSAVYLAPKNTPQGRQLSRASVDAGLKQVVLNGKGELLLSAADIFNTFGLREEIQESDFSASYQNYYETQVVRIGFKYKF